MKHRANHTPGHVRTFRVQGRLLRTAGMTSNHQAAASLASLPALQAASRHALVTIIRRACGKIMSAGAAGRFQPAASRSTVLR